MLEILIFIGVVLGVVVAGIVTSFIAVMLNLDDDPYESQDN